MTWGLAGIIARLFHNPVCGSLKISVFLRRARMNYLSKKNREAREACKVFPFAVFAFLTVPIGENHAY
jgi:hypothetical protein